MSSRRLPITHNGLLSEYDATMRKWIAEETEAIASGRASDWTDYQRRVERRKTLQRAIEELNTAVTTYLKEDEDEPADN